MTSTAATRPEFEERLLPVARRLSEALRARSFDAEAGQGGRAAPWSTRTAPTPRR
ncbi:hypothetical protein STENM223S_11875 [Streptomyces tendae]